jgi:hypothetical protein
MRGTSIRSKGCVVALRLRCVHQQLYQYSQEYLLERRLLRRRSTGELITYDRKLGPSSGAGQPAFARLAFPTWWHYDVLRALDYVRAAGGAPDARIDEAIDLLRSKQQPDGTWLLENTHPGAVHFTLEEGDGQPSRWNTLRALRVLDWYESVG